MNYQEKNILLKFFASLDRDYIGHLSNANKHTVNGFKNALQQDVYFLPKLSPSQKKWLFSKIRIMNEDEIAIIEKVNHRPIKQIVEKLESEVHQYEKHKSNDSL